VRVSASPVDKGGAVVLFPPERKRGGCLINDVGAKCCQWRIATVQAPTTWTTSDTVTVARFTFEGLVPGTQYIVQVRAFARSGSSNWSDSVAMFSN